MIQADDFLKPAVKEGFDFWTGVPCSFLTPFINAVLNDDSLQYVGATSEGEAVGIAAGAALTGRKSIAICQNSGLGNMVNPLTSIAYPFRLPLFVITTLRGEPGIQDEPQHELMGQITEKLLETMKIDWDYFPQQSAEIAASLEKVIRSMQQRSLPHALVMKQDTVDKVKLKDRPRKQIGEAVKVQGQFYLRANERIPRIEAIACLREIVGNDWALFGTTGKPGRELFALGHRPNQLYVVGGMGTASAMALGAAIGGHDRRPVAVIDGDGAALMKLGTFATIGHYQPKRFLHLVLDNEAHESTGAQATVSNTVDLAAVAAACGYTAAFRADRLQDLNEILKQAVNIKGPVMVHCKVAVGSDPKLPRPNVTPAEVKDQFMRWFQSGVSH